MSEIFDAFDKAHNIVHEKLRTFRNAASYSKTAWLTRPELFELKLPTDFSSLAPNKKGLVFDSIWKEVVVKANHKSVSIPEPLDAPFDAEHLGYKVDVKLSVGQKYFFLSHNEFLFGKENDTLFPVYFEEAGVATLELIVSFAELREAHLIQLFPSGKWVFCKKTGLVEPPWSIDIQEAKKFNLIER